VKYKDSKIIRVADYALFLTFGLYFKSLSGQMFSFRQIVLHYLSLLGVLNAIIQAFTLYFMHYSLWVCGLSILSAFMFVIVNVINYDKRDILAKSFYFTATQLSIGLWAGMLPQGIGLVVYFLTLYLIMYRVSIWDKNNWYNAILIGIGFVGILLFFRFEGTITKITFSSGVISSFQNFNFFISSLASMYVVRSIIRDQEKEEMSLFETKDKLMAIYENINVSMLFLETNHHIYWCNQYAKREFDLTFNQEVKTDLDFKKVLPISYVKRFETLFEKCLKGENLVDQMEFLNSNLSKFYFDLQYIPVYDKFNDVIGVSFHIENITRKLVVEEELTQQKHLLEIVYNQSPDALFVISPKSEKILSCNETAMQMFHLSVDSNLVTYRKLFEIEQASIFWNDIQNQLLAYGVVNFEATCRLENGSKIVGETTMKSFSINGVEHFLIRISDSTDKVKQREDQIALLNMKQQHTEQLYRQRNLETLVHGQEIERQRISKELHDGIGQMLTAIRLQVATLTSPDDIDFKENKKETNEMIDETISEVKRISNNLMPSAIADLGLLPALENLFSKIPKETKVELNYADFIKSIHFTKQQEIGIYRILQEAINNTLKYAKATRISLHITLENINLIQFFYTDNGIGFELDTEKEGGMIVKGNGLVNMKERAKMIQADFYINSSINSGTQIKLIMPFKLK
jgi:signal transduction histidine kinase